MASRSKRASQSRSAVNAAGRVLRVTSRRFNGGRAHGSRGRRRPITNVSKDEGGEPHHHGSGESATDRRCVLPLRCRVDARRTRETRTPRPAPAGRRRSIGWPATCRARRTTSRPRHRARARHGVRAARRSRPTPPARSRSDRLASPAHWPLRRQRPAPSTNRLSDSVGTSVLV